MRQPHPFRRIQSEDQRALLNWLTLSEATPRSADAFSFLHEGPQRQRRKRSLLNWNKSTGCMSLKMMDFIFNTFWFCMLLSSNGKKGWSRNKVPKGITFRDGPVSTDPCEVSLLTIVKISCALQFLLHFNLHQMVSSLFGICERSF